jgi:predicted HAD superfamily hydrolase
MHYADLMEKVAGYLRFIPFPFDLYVTITDAAAATDIGSTIAAMVPNAQLTVLPVLNIGRDVKPLYTDVAAMLTRYDIIGHIHGKKSAFNNGATEGWLDFLLDRLMGSEKTVQTIFDRFQHDPQAGLIYPTTFYRLPYWANTWLSNRGWAAKLQERLRLPSLPESYFPYPVGNMFWARGMAIRPLLELGLRESDFPVEAGQNDGEIMHALERFTTVTARANGYNNYIIDSADAGITLIDDRDSIDLSGYFGSALDYLRQGIQKPQVRVVSFDIFDTLLVRALARPDEIFELMQPEVDKVAGHKVNFRQLRIEADGWQRLRLVPGEDITLGTIYRRVGEVLRLPAAVCEKLQELELRLESQFMRVREAVVEVMNFAHDLGKRVILTSDMYLDIDFVTATLRRLGIVRYHHIYLSSQIGKRKDARTLFPHILEAENIQAEEMIHIGDNEHADLQIPGDLGILTFHVMRPMELFRQTPLGKTDFPRQPDLLSPFARISFGLMLARVFNDPFPKNASAVNGNLRNFGYWYFGPTLLAFVKWVADRAVADGIDTLYFLARDGDILVRIYRLLQERLSERQAKAVYLEVSRRSVGVPFIQQREQLDKLLQPEFCGGPLSDLVRIRLGIELEKETGLDARSFGFDSVHSTVFIPADLTKIKKLCYHLLDRCEDRFSAEKEFSLGYLKEMGLFSPGNKAVVDIGYSGTLQRILNDVSGDEPIHGYYMVLYKTFDALLKNPAARGRGLFGDRIDPYRKELSVDRYSLFYEMILSSVRGPVTHYIQDEDGRHRPVYAAVSTDEKQKLLKLPVIHEGILEYCRDVLDGLSDPQQIRADDPDFLLTPFRSFLEHPSVADLDMLAGYSLDDEYCGQGILYWAPPREEDSPRSSDPDFLWKKYVPHAPLWSDASNPVAGTNWGGFANSREHEIFSWYQEQYESLPGWFKKIGQLLKVLLGTKRIRIILEDVNYRRSQATKAEEIQAWYSKEYEVLPRWYKSFGQFIRILQGKRGWRSQPAKSNPQL